MIASSLAFISDMHIAPVAAGAERAQSALDRPERRARRLGAALEEIRELGPAAVLLGGDNTNQPVDKEEYRDALLPFLRETPRPWFIIPGNHDVGSTVGWYHHDPDRMRKACRAFREALGPDRWVCEAAGFRIIGANSQIFGSELTDAEEQAAWLSDELERPTELVKAVFLHTPPYLVARDDRFDEGSEQMCLRPEAREPLLKILDGSPPQLLITAHAHRFWTARAPGWDWLGLPATALGQDEMINVPSHHLPDGDDRVGWVALRREGEGWGAEFHPLPEETRDAPSPV